MRSDSGNRQRMAFRGEEEGSNFAKGNDIMRRTRPGDIFNTPYQKPHHQVLDLARHYSDSKALTGQGALRSLTKDDYLYTSPHKIMPPESGFGGSTQVGSPLDHAR